MSSIPVLIAARNEEATLGRTLGHLPRDVEPYVILNGCTDATADVAYGYADSGATVLESDQGKMAALQEGLRYLGRRATEPIITLDADSYPVFKNRWISALLRVRARLDPNQPAAVVGGAVYHGVNTMAGNAASTILEARRQFLARHTHKSGTFPGRNMLVDLRHPDVVARAIEAQNYWPGEDQFLADLAVVAGGATLKACTIAAAVWTEGDRQLGFMSRFTMTRARRQAITHDSYLSSGIPGVTVPYPGMAACPEFSAAASASASS